MHFILIIIAFSGMSNGGTSVDHIEFNDKASCIAAADHLNRNDRVMVLCAQKGKE